MAIERSLPCIPIIKKVREKGGGWWLFEGSACRHYGLRDGQVFGGGRLIEEIRYVL